MTFPGEYHDFRIRVATARREVLTRKPIAFMSYVRFDDEHENGRLTQFRERLSGEVRIQTGEGFDIFQDRNDIAWGQQWKKRIEESIDAVTFLIPVVTPAFFKSPACREEMERFLKHEEVLGRSDLILPVYYVECATLSDEAKRERDPLAKAIAARQYADWREFRFEPFTSPDVGRRLASIARQIVEALEREPASTTPPAAKSAAGAEGATLGSEVQTLPAREGALAKTSEPARGPGSKTEAVTLVVDALHRGDYSTITQALAAAEPGARLLVRPGLYREGIVIDKPVEILGDGEVSDIVIEASGERTVQFQAAMGRIANLTLRQAGGKAYCVGIAQGRLDLEDCDITSRGLSCVAIHGGADPRLRRNRIHDGKEVGILVYENGQGTLEDNEIFANAYAGVEIKTGGNPILRRNRIHDGKETGVHVHKNGQGTLEDNEIFGNTLAGVTIRTGGNPTLRRNRIHDGRQAGVLVAEHGQGTLEDNEIFGNAYAGVEIRAGGNPILRRNRISENRDQAVRVHHAGAGTFNDNDLRGNTKGAWSISPDSEAGVKRKNDLES
jgi:parallel beta-helix repeat protein